MSTITKTIPALKIYSIFESNPTSGFSSVSVNREILNLVKGFNPSLPFQKVGAVTQDSKEYGVRMFDINGIQLFVKKSPNDNKHFFAVRTEIAKKLLVTDRAVKNTTISLGLTDFDNAGTTPKNKVQYVQASINYPN